MANIPNFIGNPQGGPAGSGQGRSCFHGFNKNSNGNFSPNYFVKVSNSSFLKKINALKCYKSEMRKWPHPRSLRALKVLAQRRGSMVGLDMAEAFSLFRVIKR